jgi:hypothetical protein
MSRRRYRVSTQLAKGITTAIVSAALLGIPFAGDARAANADGGPTPAETCALAKSRAVERQLRAKLHCYQRSRLDQSTVDRACLLTAEAKFAREIARTETSGGCIHTNDGDLLASVVDSWLGELLYFTPTAPVCGDGFVSPGESCDPYAFPNGCASDLGCDYASCTCGAVCGDGLLSPGETCDPYAYPSGCSDGTVCSHDCTGCVVPPAGYCVPTSPDTCSAGLSGCAQPCDDGTDGSACVSTSPGGDVVCVQTVCTFRTCNSAADCGANEVCFTEGCCGPTAAAAATVATTSWP